MASPACPKIYLSCSETRDEYNRNRLVSCLGGCARARTHTPPARGCKPRAHHTLCSNGPRKALITLSPYPSGMALSAAESNSTFPTAVSQEDGRPDRDLANGHMAGTTGLHVCTTHAHRMFAPCTHHATCSPSDLTVLARDVWPNDVE